MLNKINITSPKQILIVYIVLTLATLAVYWQVNKYDFVNFDDPVYIVENSHIQSGITPDGFRWAFSTRYADLWNPLIWLSFMFDYQLYGLNAGGYHLTNLILHILSTLLLFRLFNRMTKALWRSALVAALFALHPLHVESVAWITERKDVLSAFFWMLTLCLYVYYTEKPLIRRYLLVLFSFVCALMSKPMVVTLPVIMILLDYWPLKRFESKKNKLVLWQLKEKTPFFVLSAVLFAIMIYINFKPQDVKQQFPLTLSFRLANALASFVAYLGKTFWPHDMAIIYPFPDQIPFWQVLGAAILILVISTAVIVMVKRLPYLFVGWLWYAITLLTVIGWIGVIIPAPYAMTDRYHYLPSVGIAVMLAWGIPLLFPNEEIRKKILFPMAILFIAILSFLTWRQCGYWKNSNTLFTHALQVTKDKDNDVAQVQLGIALFEEGKFEEAIEHYNKAILMKSSYADACVYNCRGGAYAALGQYQRAIEDFNKDISMKHVHFKSYNNRGVVYTHLGQYQRAIEDFNEAIKLNPAYAIAYKNRATVYLNIRDNSPGCRDAKKACELGNCQIWESPAVRKLCR